MSLGISANGIGASSIWARTPMPWQNERVRDENVVVKKIAEIA